MPIVLEEVDCVLVHKNKCILDSFTCLADSRTKKVDVYANPQQFFANARQYPKNTKIIFGNRFDEDEQIGMQIAYHLSDLGFKRLYLITFPKLLTNQIPAYLTNISSIDVDRIISVLDDYP